jgi:hypothetical protein
MNVTAVGLEAARGDTDPFEERIRISFATLPSPSKGAEAT